jgi:predicted transcriptional regulator
MAGKVGVSKQSLYRYESSGRMSLDVFEHFMEFFEGAGLVLPTLDLRVEQPKAGPGGDVGVRMNQLKSMVLSEFRNMGFTTSLTKAPFDVIATEEERVFTLVSNDWRRLKHKIDVLDEISGIVGGYSVCISERRVASSRRDLSPSDLKEVKTARELFKLLSE